MTSKEFSPRRRKLGIALAGTITAATLAYATMEANGYSLPHNIGQIDSNTTIHLKDEPSTTPEVLARINTSLVTIHTTIKPDFRKGPLSNTSFNCNGFFIKDAKNSPVIISARHCLPNTIKGTDGATYSTITSGGKSILQSEVKDRQQRLYPIDTVSYIRTDETNTETDIITLKTASTVLEENVGIEIDTKTTLGEEMALLRIDSNSTLKVVPMYLISDTKEGILTLLAFENPDNSCIKGASGSAIINKDGKLTGVLSSGSEKSIIVTREYIEKYHLNEDLIGKIAKECYAVGSNTVSKHVNN